MLVIYLPKTIGLEEEKFLSLNKSIFDAAFNKIKPDQMHTEFKISNIFYRHTWKQV